MHRPGVTGASGRNADRLCNQGLRLQGSARITDNPEVEALGLTEQLRHGRPTKRLPRGHDCPEYPEGAPK
jgi:hypothetical protein